MNTRPRPACSRRAAHTLLAILICPAVGSEDDPIKLCAAAVFSYLADLPACVFHSRAGSYGWERCCPPAGNEVRFEETPGLDAFQFIRRVLPGDLASWARNDGREPRALSDAAIPALYVENKPLPDL